MITMVCNRFILNKLICLLLGAHRGDAQFVENGRCPLRVGFGLRVMVLRPQRVGQLVQTFGFGAAQAQLAEYGQSPPMGSGIGAPRAAAPFGAGEVVRAV
jgi:hypothetical protein